jgi:hypothetical protein
MCTADLEARQPSFAKEAVRFAFPPDQREQFEMTSEATSFM